MESSNQGTKDGTNPRQQILEKETIKKTTARIEIRKLIETSEENAAEETAKSQIHKETHEKKKLIIFIIYLYPINSHNCQIFKEKKKIAERNKQKNI